MKCPKCGNEIKDGHLYCDVCGEEIRIVPDFDESNEETINISFTDDIDTEKVLEELNVSATKEVVKDLEKEATKEINVFSRVNTDAADSDSNRFDNKFLIRALVIAGAVCAVFIFIFAVVYTKINNYYSVDKQYELAFDQFENGEYDLSNKTLKHAMSIDDEDPRLKMLIADNYFMLLKYDESIAVLYDLLEKYPADSAIIDRLIRSYEAKGDMKAIDKLLDEQDNEEVLKMYADYIAEDVSFSYPSGDYSEIITLELTSNEGCAIYYTLDGSEVSESSLLYTEPVTLDNGEYVINAIAVNSKGVVSSVTSAEYKIDFYKPDMPVLKTGTGKYNTPKSIEVEFADFDLCYYTIDGDDPTEEDERYQGPFAMYIGTHTYKFAVISNKGVSSDVVTAEITMDLITLIDMETATNNLVTWISASGQGNKDYSYKCEQAYETGNSIYYIINEYSHADSSDEHLTGNHFAVDVLTGMTYRASLDKASGKYTLDALTLY